MASRKCTLAAEVEDIEAKSFDGLFANIKSVNILNAPDPLMFMENSI